MALLGFLVFLFYIIYSFLNNSGNGRRSLAEPLDLWGVEEPEEPLGAHPGVRPDTVMVALVRFTQP